MQKALPIRLSRRAPGLDAHSAAALERDTACVETTVEGDQAFVTFGAVLVLHNEFKRQSPHAHRPYELVAALDGSFTFADPDGVVQKVAHIVAPLEEHAVLGCDGRLARLYVDPGMHRLPARRLGDMQISPNAHDEIRSALRYFHTSRRRVDEARSLINRWQSVWLRDNGRLLPLDARIRKALACIDAQPIPEAKRADLGSMVGLSPSRFAALFLQEVGMPLRRYVLWRRVLVAARLIREGDTITRAAARSGFADAAHLSRCYRSTFGTSPSQLAQIDVPQPIAERNRHFDER